MEFLRVNKITMKKFLKNFSFEIDFKLEVPAAHVYSEHTQHKRCEKLGRNPD